MTARPNRQLEKLQALFTRNIILVAESYKAADQADVALHAWPCGQSGLEKVYVEVLNRTFLDKVVSTLTRQRYGLEPDHTCTDSVYLKVSGGA